MKIGYARVSTKEQSFDLQLDALHKAGCKVIHQDIASGARAKRPALDDMLSRLREGDVIVVWKLDRLGRSLKHLVDLVDQLGKQEVGLQSLQDPIDTTTPQGRLNFNIFSALAEFERDLIGERTKAGLKAARARGRLGGRPKGLSPQAEAKAIAAEAMYKKGELSVQEIANRLEIVKATVYAYLRHRQVPIGPYHSKKNKGKKQG